MDCTRRRTMRFFPMHPSRSIVFGLLFLLMAVPCARSQEPIRTPAETSPRPARAAAESKRYYIDFRAAQIGAYGHSYVAFGRLDARGRPASADYADLHPMGGYLVMAVGHVLPVPANTTWDPGVLKLPVASSYFRPISAAQYARLQAAIRATRANPQPYWNALTYNCNHFVAKLARAVGLAAPDDLKLAYAFVPALRELNESPAAGLAAARRRAAPASASAAPAPQF